MSDLRPERDWFEKAHRDIELAEQVAAVICPGVECDCSRPAGQDAPPTECP